MPLACKQWQYRGIGGMADDRVDGRPMEEVGWTRVMGSKDSAPRGCATMLLRRPGWTAALLATAFRT